MYQRLGEISAATPILAGTLEPPKGEPAQKEGPRQNPRRNRKAPGGQGNLARAVSPLKKESPAEASASAGALESPWIQKQRSARQKGRPTRRP